MNHSAPMSRKIELQKDWIERALIKAADYKRLYQRSLQEPEAFWAEQAERLKWSKKWTKVKDTSFETPVKIRWFEGGELNVAVNCLDRHLPDKKDQIAFHWEPDDPMAPKKSITYGDLSKLVNQTSHALTELGVKKGDRVTIYLPMILEAAAAMLACARIGAIHSVVFAGFSPDALAGRIVDCESTILITSDEGLRAGKKISLKANSDEAAAQCPSLKKILVVAHTKATVSMTPGRDVFWHDIVFRQPTEHKAAAFSANDPLFILYTSGSTNKPKGVLHGMGGYLLFASLTHQSVFDYHPGDIYWCAADIGWVTGHSYIVYGPLSNGATSVLFEGVPTWPDSSRLWQVVDKYKVNILYTAPTLIRALMKEGEAFVKKTSRKSLRILGSVGEPINPEAWEWYFKNGGDSRCPIVDTWWQTETGGILITPLPGVTTLKPGSATRPFFGVQPVLLDDQGNELHGATKGNLCLKDSWPGQMQTVFRDHDRFEQTYFSQYKGFYFTGDGATRDEDGDYWITGRVDDVLNVSGHRLGTAEVESALVAHSAVAEAAVVGYPHDLKGQGIYAYVTLKAGKTGTDELRSALMEWVKKEISPIAKPDVIQWAPGLPKTRSGKIMRRILRKIAASEFENLGDISTLADPNVVQELILGRSNS